MARQDTSSKKKRVSLDDEDATSGLFGSGPATIKESLFADYDYGGNAKPTPVWLIVFERDGEEYEQPYSIGKGWKVSKDGLTIEPKAGQGGLPDSCNAMVYLVKPLKKALKKSDIEIDFRDGDPSVLDGLEVIVERVDQEERVIKGQKARDPEKGPRTILTFTAVTGDGSDSKKSSSKKKSKPADDDDDDEKPVRKARGKAAVADDDDDDEAPVAKKRGSKKPAEDDDDDDEDAAPARGKKKVAKADDDDDDDDEDAKPAKKGKSKADPIAEAGIEAIIEVASEAVAYDDLEKLLKKELKGNDDAAEIIEWCMDTDNLEKELGWTWNPKKELISAE